MHSGIHAYVDIKKRKAGTLSLIWGSAGFIANMAILIIILRDRIWTSKYLSSSKIDKIILNPEDVLPG